MVATWLNASSFATSVARKTGTRTGISNTVAEDVERIKTRGRRRSATTTTTATSVATEEGATARPARIIKKNANTNGSVGARRSIAEIASLLLRKVTS